MDKPSTTHNKHFFIHVFDHFLQQPLPTKLFIIGVIVIALATPVLLLSPILARADSPSITLNPTDDGYVNKSSQRSNYNDKEIKSDKDRTAYLKFNLTSLAGQPIKKAELRMYVTGDSKVSHQLKQVTNTNWSETNLNYQNRPGVSNVIATVSGTKKKAVGNY